MIVNFDELVSPILLVKEKTFSTGGSSAETVITSVTCKNVQYETAREAFINNRWLDFKFIDTGEGDNSISSGCRIIDQRENRIFYDKNNDTLSFPRSIIWNSRKLGRRVRIEHDERINLTDRNPIYGENYITEIISDINISNIIVKMKNAPIESAEETQLEGVYNYDAHILNIPEVTGSISILINQAS